MTREGWGWVGGGGGRFEDRSGVGKDLMTREGLGWR